ncbi:MAG: peptidyl-prolyl cis-trans isomerase, partial [Caulobacteraceae bacterium]
MLTKAGIVPAPQLVDDEIKKLPGAFDRVTGKFSEQQFLELLASNGLTPKQAEAELSDEVAQRHFNVAIEAGFKAPKLYSALSAVAGLENRDISLFVLPPNIVLKPAAPTDAQLAQFEKAHAAQLMLPERRTITLVRFSAAAVAPSIKLDPKAIQQAFAAQKASLTTPETRTIIQIPVRNPAEGAKAAKLLAAGGDPTQIARSLGAEPVIYTDQPLSAIADPKIGAAAFAMKAGQTAGPISGTLGMAAIKVVKVTAGKAADFATAEPKIEADLRERQAEDQAYNQSQNFDNLREAGDTIAQAAQKVGAALVTVGPVDAKGQDANGKTNPLLDAKMLKTAFAAAPGEETDLEDEGHGEYYALRIDKVLPPALPAIDQNRAALSAAYIQLGYLQALGAKAQSLIDAVKGGKSMDAVAAEVGAKVIKVPGMERINAQKYQALGERFVEGVFGASRGDVFGSMTPKGVVIAKLDA